MNRRNFIRLAGGGTIAAATTGTLVACGAVGSHYPAEAVEAWQGPVGETDVRRRAVAYAITAPNSHNLQPWLVDLRESGVITLRTDPARVLPQTDPWGRQILIGHGAFLELLVMALAQQGMASEVLLWPQGEMPAALKDWDDRPVARITLRASSPSPRGRAAAFAGWDARRGAQPIAPLLASAATPQTARQDHCPTGWSEIGPLDAPVACMGTSPCGASEASTHPDCAPTRPLGDGELALAPGGQPDPLFAQVLLRRTPKTDFDTTRPVAPELLARLLRSAPVQAPLSVGGTVSDAQLPALRTLCWESARVELLTPATMMESIQLTRVGPAEILQHRDGISINSPFVRAVDALGMFDRTQPPAEGSAAYKSAMGRFEGHSRTAMGFVWITGPNTRSDQIHTGRLYVRQQLQATALGVGMHPMSQAVQEFAEMAPHFERVHQLVLGRPAPRTPQEPTVQMFCRIGYPQGEVPATPRRPLARFVQA